MTRLRCALVVAALLATHTSGTARQEAATARSPRNANYTLFVELDPTGRTLEGAGRVHWRNISAAPATELRLHMYWNAWRDPASTWQAEQRMGGNASVASRPTEDYGYINLATIQRVAANGPVNLRPGIRYIAPDDGNREDYTVLSVPLDEPVPPGRDITLDLTWSAHVPRTYARTGALGDSFFIAQWFPKLAVLEDDGWNSHQFHAATEFYADFGTYDVSMTVPTGWVLGASGREISRTEHGDGTTTHRYVEEDIHDFAWTTSPDFIERRATFEADGLPAVDIRLLLQPVHEGQAERYLAATRAALDRYGRWFGPYPWPQLTVIDPVAIVHPASQGGSTGGMEYPTLITGGTRWLAPMAGSAPDAVTIHEVGHQFWYGIVATNEVEHAWMDEGLNTYAAARVLDDAMSGRFVAVSRYFGGLVPWAYDDVPWSRDIDGNRMHGYRTAARAEIPSTPTWQYWPGTAGRTSYNKTALWLATLEKHLGWPAMQRILAAYFDRGAFRHPTPDEFFAVANEVSGQDLNWFFDQVHRSDVAFDYSVSHVQTVGTYDALISTVVITREEDGVFPVSVRVRFDDGEETVETVDGRSRRTMLTFARDTPVTEVEIDPDRVLLLDTNATNNSWTSRPRATDAASRWSWRWLAWVEELLLTYAIFA